MSKQDVKPLDPLVASTKDVEGDATSADADAGQPLELVSAEDDKRVLRRIDWHMQPVIMVIYFLVTLDKASLSYTSVFGIQHDAKLVGNQYSLLSSVVYIAQLVFQPISALAIIKLRLSLWVGALITLWGITLASGAAAYNFSGLFAMRFFLGGLESSIAPCNVALTQAFYRRSEQGFRTSTWYAMNGVSTIIGSAIAYGLGHVHSDKLYSYQVIFLTLGLLTVAYGMTTFFTVPDSIDHAYFLKNGDDRRIARERVRFNQAGTDERKFSWPQCLETFLDLKSWVWMSLAFLISIPSGGFSNFQALILQGFGFDKYQVMLLSMPVGAMQIISIFAAFWASSYFKNKTGVLLGVMVPTLIGGGMLYGLGREPKDRPALLVAYYLTVCYVAVTPLLFNWHSSNVAGRTKKALTTAFFVAGQAGGNLVGPFLFKSSDAPYYKPGLRAVLIILCALVLEISFMAGWLFYLNKRNERRRAARGMSAKLTDYSMLNPKEVQKHKEKEEEKQRQQRQQQPQGASLDAIPPIDSDKQAPSSTAAAHLQIIALQDGKKANEGTAELGFAPSSAPLHGAHAFDDLTDLENDEFIYVY
ncbi:MFS general substrate transporter [Tilletiaria anomala UBC 951]|uniref:MFS general substrate transporter n=1 Tax=Tilletiaria anomala (strain ATCC 24038 / CBS 436.72 / UBC 951) TaxID=1037660 RepID=A0A066WN80_TILAU|nr:MFS general substrate transporter [Tilletiaria anomala UBC 951]KDN52085.1 MFS general substrate transporter [Tilletiaria anomala UBC 951]